MDVMFDRVADLDIGKATRRLVAQLERLGHTVALDAVA